MVIAMVSRLRPNRSDSAPKQLVPTTDPSRVALNSIPKSIGDRCHAAEIAGATKPIDCVSNPSSTAMRMHIANTIFCNPPIGASSIASPTVLPIDVMRSPRQPE